MNASKSQTQGTAGPALPDGQCRPLEGVARSAAGEGHFASTVRTVSATFSGVKPKCLNSTGAGADSP
jgi:hypothetical protein